MSQSAMQEEFSHTLLHK